MLSAPNHGAVSPRSLSCRCVSGQQMPIQLLLTVAEGLLVGLNISPVRPVTPLRMDYVFPLASQHTPHVNSAVLGWSCQLQQAQRLHIDWTRYLPFTFTVTDIMHH